MKIRELMSSSVHSCRSQDTLDTVARALWEHDCGALPVLDGEGRVGAMITDRDICMAAGMTGKALAELRVADAMSKDLVTCKPGDTVSAALRQMGERQLHRLPAVDGDGKLVGILTLNDLITAGESRVRIGREALKALAAVSRHRASVPTVTRKAPPVLAKGAAAEGQQG